MKHQSEINNNKLTALLIPSFDHKELEDEDDCGLPEDPIFSNYSKYLWKGHSQNKRIRTLSRVRKNTNGSKNIK
jgi:hypothetical protein